MSEIVILSLERQTKGRRRLLLDNGEVWVLYAGELGSLHLAEGTHIPEEQYIQIRREVIGKRAKKRAMHLLERMDRTELELRRKLADGEYPEDLIDEALAYVKSYHYIDDERYADCYVRLRGTAKSNGRLRMELQRRGVERDVAERVLASYEEERDERAMIRDLLQKRHYDPQTADQKEQRRMYGYLQRRGFSSPDISRELRLS